MKEEEEKPRETREHRHSRLHLHQLETIKSGVLCGMGHVKCPAILWLQKKLLCHGHHEEMSAVTLERREQHCIILNVLLTENQLK